MMIGVSLFLIGSLLCGLSQEMWQLILFRGIQGLGAGAIFPISLAVIGDLFSPRERGRYQGLFGGVFALASIIGPALGGFLTDSLSWHWVFLVNLPLGIVALFVLWRLLPPIRHPERVISIDYLGAAVFAAALIPLLIGLTNKQFSEWSDPLVGGLIAARAAAQRRIRLGRVASGRTDPAARAVPQPDGDRQHHRDLPHHLRLLRRDHLHSALVPVRPRLERDEVRLPDAAPDGRRHRQLDRLRADRRADGPLQVDDGRRHRALVDRPLLHDRAFVPTPPLPLVWLWMFIAGLGIGPSFAIFTTIVQSAVAPRMLGAATSSLTFFRQVGGSVGLAIAGTIFGSSFTAPRSRDSSPRTACRSRSSMASPPPARTARRT